MPTNVSPRQPVTLTVEQSLQQATIHHKVGQLQKAEDIYRAILQSHPNHPEANHNMGALVVQMKQPAAGLSYFIAALNADPARRQYWLSYIDALLLAGQVEDARQVLALARQHGLQGAEVEVLAVRLEKSALVATQSNIDNQHAFKESNPSPQEVNALVALFNEGRLTEAATLAQEMTVNFPLHEFGWKALGEVFKKMGRIADALAPMQKAAALSPSDVAAHYNLGNTLKDLDRLEEAEASYRRALQIKPDLAEAHSNLGNILKDLGRLDEAETSYRQALQITPDYVEAHSNLGITLKDMGHLDEAEASYRRALQINPDYADAHYNLGNILTDMSRVDEAEACYRRALQIKPDFVQAYNNLGATLNNQGKFNEAIASYRQALQIKPDFVETYNNLGSGLANQGKLNEAIACYQQAIQIKPDFVEAYNNMSQALRRCGQFDKAMAAIRRGLEINPNNAMAHSNLIFTLDMAADLSISTLQEERKAWGAIHAAHLLQHHPYSNTPDPERRLRIGYICADSRSFSAPSVFGAMLLDFDRSSFDVTLYLNNPYANELTHRLRQSVTCWRNIFFQSDDAVANLIRQDNIDILVDLWGQAPGNRLLVFARKPAPIQITAWGYPLGTGMKAMDVLFSDPIVIPPDEKHFYTEQVRYLPCFLSYYLLRRPPAVNVLPALSAKWITFGSFNRLEKNMDEAYETWARILLAIPNSRMLFKAPELDDVGNRNLVTGKFTRAGIAPERIILLGNTSWDEHMAAYNQIDISLNPFPQGGGVTSLEGLIMGVPMVTLVIQNFAGRVGASILTTLGLTDWIAETREQYVAIAIQKAQDISALADLRQKIRTLYETSAIGNIKAYVNAAETEYRKLWQEWCARQ